uniref:Uncharacterized protein n=1 Tax=Avena sativa TaxID=4498 RepID=A0ACD5Z5H8_AVESA
MADNRRKDTAGSVRRDGGRGGQALRRVPWPPQAPRLPAWCISSGQRRSSADLAEEAVDVVSRHLGYFKVPCPYKEYGCASSVVSRAAACAHAPCACPECAFLGSPAQLVRHLTDPAGPHQHWTATKLTYGKEFRFVVNMLEEPRQDKYLLVAEEDRAVFLLALGVGDHGQDPRSGRAAVVCVRGNADAGPVYGCSLVVDCLPRALHVSETMVVLSCSAPGEFDVDAPCVSACQFSLQGKETKELHLRVRVHLQDQGYELAYGICVWGSLSISRNWGWSSV